MEHGEDESCEASDGVGVGFGEEESGAGWEFVLVFFGEALEAGGDVKKVFVGISGDVDSGYLLFKVIFDQLDDDSHTCLFLL